MSLVGYFCINDDFLVMQILFLKNQRLLNYILKILLNTKSNNNNNNNNSYNKEKLKLWYNNKTHKYLRYVTITAFAPEMAPETKFCTDDGIG